MTKQICMSILWEWALEQMKKQAIWKQRKEKKKFKMTGEMIYHHWWKIDLKNRTTPAHPRSSVWVYMHLFSIMHTHIYTLLFHMHTFCIVLSVAWGPYGPRDLSQDPCSIRMRSFAFGFKSGRVSLDSFAAWKLKIWSSASSAHDSA